MGQARQQGQTHPGAQTMEISTSICRFASAPLLHGIAGVERLYSVAAAFLLIEFRAVDCVGTEQRGGR